MAWASCHVNSWIQPHYKTKCRWYDQLDQHDLQVYGNSQLIYQEGCKKCTRGGKMPSLIVVIIYLASRIISWIHFFYHS